MRVLFVNENIGGHATVHAHLRTALAARSDIDARFLDVPRASGLRRLVGAQVPGLAGPDLDLQPLRAQLALSGWVRRRLTQLAGDVDVVHIYTGNAALRSVPMMGSIPTVVSTDATNATNAYRLPYRTPSRFTPATVRVARRFEAPVYRAARLVVASTDWVAASLRDDYGVPDGRLRVQPFGIAAPDFGPGPAPGGPSGTLPQVVFVGRQLERKGALRLLRLHQEHLADECELVLVTPEPVPAGRNVRVVPDVSVGSPKLWTVLRTAAVFAFPSTIDQASNAVIEALAAGLPVLGIQQGAMGELVTPRTGRLVPADDDHALVESLRELVDDGNLRASLGAAARQDFLERYDVTVTADRLVTLLAEACGAERRQGASA